MKIVDNIFGFLGSAGVGDEVPVGLAPPAGITKEELEFIESARGHGLFKQKEAEPVKAEVKAVEPEKKLEEKRPSKKQPRNAADVLKANLHKKPALAQVTYPVYLITLDDVTYPTRILEHEVQGVRLHYLELNQFNYLAPEKNTYSASSSTILYNEIVSKKEPGVLEQWTHEFTPKAKNEIMRVESSKLWDRAYEKTYLSHKARFAPPLNAMVLFGMLIFAIACLLLFWVTFNGLPGVIGAINSAPSMVYASDHPPPVNTSNSVVVPAENKTIVTGT